MLRTRTAALGIAILAVASREAKALVTDPNFTESVIYVHPSFPRISGVAFPPDGSNRLFFTAKNGTVNVLENGVLLTPPFATVTPITITSECGLIGLAFDPNFVENGFLYLFVTVSATEQQIIRYTANGNLGEDKTIVMTGLPTIGANHDGGAVGIGPDGKIYWSIGDNGNRSGVDGDLLSLASKVGRANIDGSAPNDNPFFDGAGPNNDYVWARGFRNPFTFTFQPSTENLWVNVTGAQFEQVFEVFAGGHAGWDNFQANQPGGFMKPKISYVTNNVATRMIAAAGAIRQGGVARFTTSAEHRFQPGAKITVSGVTDPSFDETDYVVDVLTPTEFTFAQPGPDATSGGGTAVTQVIGGAITGGTFWDSSGVPPSYQGNFFFGDYVSGRVMRATLDAQNKVTSVDQWGTDVAFAVDMAVGPDGALYYAGHRGQIRRAAYNFTSQAIIVSKLHVRMAEGGASVFTVRLATAPAAATSVSVTRTAGSPNVRIGQGSTLNFGPTNWSVPQVVRVIAIEDQDSVDETAEIDVSSPVAPSEGVLVRVTDDEVLGLLLSTTAVTLDEGGTGSFLVRLSGPPVAPIVVSAAHSDGDSDVTVAGGPFTFTAANEGAWRTVTLAAAEDADAANDVATISVSGAGLPTREVVVDVIDNDYTAPVISSAPVTSAIAGAPYLYDVEADGLPAPVFSFDSAPGGMVIDAASGMISWTPGVAGMASVVVRAANGVQPDATQAFDIVVVDDLPPACVLTEPKAGAEISGVGAEFFGDVQDDVGAVSADFYVDGALVYSDLNSEGHYHYGGGHALFDTTALTDGPHVLGIMGTDTSGQTCVVEVNVVVANGSAGEGGAAGAAGEGGSAGASSAGTGGTSGEPSGGAGGSGGGATPEGGNGTDAGTDAAGAAGTPEAEPGLTGGGGGGCDCASARSGRSGAWAVMLGLGALLRRRRSRPSLRQA